MEGLKVSMLVFDIDGGADLLAGEPGIEIVEPKTPVDILRRLMQLDANVAGVRTVALDVLTGYFSMAKQSQRGPVKLGAEYEGDFSLNWNKMMGEYRDIILQAKTLVRRYGIHFVVTAHPREDYIELSADAEGKKVKRLVGWSIDVPGKGDNDIFSPFDEIYLLTEQSGVRTLHAARTMIGSAAGAFPFKAKSRFGVRSPIQAPTYDKIVTALPEAVRKAGKLPHKWCIVAEPGVGKTTLLGTWPR